MGKRSSFTRRPRDFYPSPREVVAPLAPHLPAGVRYCEPCAGDGSLVRHLNAIGHDCVAAYDIEPMDDEVNRLDASFLSPADLGAAEMIITNPPWERKCMHNLISRFLCLEVPTWLLFDADWSFTAQASEYLPYVAKIVAVGRVKWIPGSASNGMDPAAWYLFDGRHAGHTLFFGK